MRRRSVLVALSILIVSCGSASNEGGSAGATAKPEATTSAPGVSDDGQSAPVEIDGTSLDPIDGGGVFDDPAIDPVVGSVAPVLQGTGFDGDDVVIGPDGRPKVVYFLAHWCSHCQDEVRAITELVADGAQPDGVDIYAVAIAVRDDQPNYPPSAWLADFPGAVMRDSVDNEAASAAGVSGIPYALYLDGDHLVLARSVGSLSSAAIADRWARLAGS